VRVRRRQILRVEDVVRHQNAVHPGVVGRLGERDIVLGRRERGRCPELHGFPPCCRWTRDPGRLRRFRSRRGDAVAQVEVERDGAVMVVTLNRPHRKNAMTLTMFALLADAWEEVTANDDIRCVILTGAEGEFSSGMDLRALAGDVEEPDAIDTDARMKEDPGFIYRGLLK